MSPAFPGCDSRCFSHSFRGRLLASISVRRLPDPARTSASPVSRDRLLACPPCSCAAASLGVHARGTPPGGARSPVRATCSWAGRSYRRSTNNAEPHAAQPQLWFGPVQTFGPAQNDMIQAQDRAQQLQLIAAKELRRAHATEESAQRRVREAQQLIARVLDLTRRSRARRSMHAPVLGSLLMCLWACVSTL